MKKARGPAQNDSIQDSAALSVDQDTSLCRCCLVTERRMVNAMLFEASFKDLTGITISSTDGLPQWLCYECSALLDKCVTFRNKVIKSHYRLCQYLLESVPITIDEDAAPHLSRTSVLHCHIAGTQTDKLEEQIDDTVKYGTGMFCETVKVKVEPILADSEDNIVEEKYREETPQIQLGSSLLTCVPLDINSIVTVKHEEQTEEGEIIDEDAAPHLSRTSVLHCHIAGTQTDKLEEQIDDTVKYGTGMFCETVKVKVEPIFSDSEDNIVEEKYREETPQIQLGSSLLTCDPLDINSVVTVKHEEQTEEGEGSSQEPHVGTEAAQQHLHKHVCASETWRHDKERQHSADNTSTRLSDDTEEEVKHNINRDDIVNISSHSNVQSYICDSCNKCFSDKDLLITHIREHSTEKLFKCDFCCIHFSDDFTLNKHSRVHTAAKQYHYKCDVCMKRFYQKSNLKRHMRVHTGDKLYKCDVCMKCFGWKSILQTHMRLHSGDKPYKCDVCMKLFRRNSHLKIHMLVHTDDKAYKCDVCMKRFSRKSDFVRHLRVHTGDKPYKCDVCMKHFSVKYHLMDHMRIHTGEGPYKCDVCLKCFDQKRYLNRHMRVHTGDKPYKCDICMKCFGWKSGLQSHMYLHSGDKPYKCDVCMKLFSKNSHLNIHMLVHTGDKPYKCDVCMKCFSQKSNLNTHMRLHTGDKPYKCDVCMKRFREKANLSSHFRIHNGT